MADTAPDVGQSDQQPTDTTMSVETFTVTDSSTGGWWWSEASLDIEWQLTGEYQDVSVTVVNLDTGQTVAQYSGLSGYETYTDYDEYGDNFEITLEATAADGSSVCQRYTGPADGTNNFQFEDCGSDGGQPDIVTTSASASASEITVGNEVDVTAELANEGDAEGTHTAELTVDGSVVATKEVTLAAGESTTVTFTESFDSTGTYALAVDGVDAGSVTVTEPSDGDPITAFEVTDSSSGGLLSNVNLGIEWETDAQQVSSATVTVINLGPDEVEAEYSGTSGLENYSSNVFYDSGFAVRLEATLTDGSTVCQRLSGRADGTDDFVSRVDCDQNGQPSISLSDATLSAQSINATESIDIEAELTNTGDAYGNRSITFTSDGEELATRTVNLLPNETRTRTISQTFDETGTYTIAVDGTTAGTLTVSRSAEADISILDASLSSDTVSTGEQLDVTVTLQNAGGAAGTKELALSKGSYAGESGSTILDSKSVTVQANTTKTVTFTQTFESPTDATLYVNRTRAGFVEVLGPEVDVTEEYDLTPQTEGSVTVTTSFDIPAGANAFEIGLTDLTSDNVTVLSKSGFEIQNTNVLVWDNQTSQASITIRKGIPEKDSSIDAGEWAFFTGLNYFERTNPVTVVDRISGSDITASTEGDSPWILLGPHELYTTTTQDQTIRLAIADSASIDMTPETMLSILENTSRTLDVGEYDDTVTGFGVSGEVPGPGGRAYDNKFRFTGSSALLIHEYIHTRDTIDRAQGTRWLNEALAVYYEGVYEFRFGSIPYEEFQTYRTGDPVDLTDTSQWDGGVGGAEYSHGSDILNALDSKVRTATDNEKTLEDVFQRMNTEYSYSSDKELTIENFKQLLSDMTGGEQFDTFFTQYVSGTQVPPGDSNPDKYAFTETETVSGTIASDAGATGFVGADSKLAVDLINHETRDAVRSSFYATDSPDTGGSWSLSLFAGLTDPIFDPPSSSSAKDLAYVQYNDTGQSFPQDGVPDVAVLGSTDGTIDPLPSDAKQVTVTAVDQTGDPLADITTDLTVNPAATGVTVSETTSSDGSYAPGGVPGLELSGQYELSLTPENKDRFGRQRVTARLDADRDENVQVVYHTDSAEPLSLQGTVMPAANVTAGESFTLSVLYSETEQYASSRTVPVYVDGQQIKSIDVAPDDRVGAKQFSLTLSDGGDHTVRVGDLPGQTVTVNGSDDDNDGEDYEPNLVSFDVIDQSYSGWYSDQAEFDISWEVTHAGNALQDVEVTVTNLDQSITRETYTGATGSQTYYDSGGYYNSEYNDQFRIRITAVDDNGDQICQEYVGPADGYSDNFDRQSCSTGADASSNSTQDRTAVDVPVQADSGLAGAVA